MEYIKSYEFFNKEKNTFEILLEDKSNFNIIFNTMYNYHLSINEKMIIENEYGLITEEFDISFSKLADKAKRGVLKVQTAAQKIIVDLAAKAKDVLDWAKQLAKTIGDYAKTQFTKLLEGCKNKVLAEAPFIDILLKFINAKHDKFLKQYITKINNLVKYIIGGQMFTDLFNKLSKLFSSILQGGNNEGLYNMENDFLFESDGEEKKSFLERIGEKLKTYPPFSWIPKLDEFVTKGITYVGGLVDKFFGWLQSDNISEAIDLTRGKREFGESYFGKGIMFLFQILELFIIYKIKGKIDSTLGITDFVNSVKDSSILDVWNAIGINPKELIKSSISQIPYIGQIQTLIDYISTGLGVYLAIKPTFDKLGIL